jgi:capsular exopolysaccharide synthesis family protein
VDFRRQLGIARKWFPLLVAGAILSAAAAFGLSSVQQRIYEAKATLIVGQALQNLNPNVDQLNVSQRLSATYAAVATKRPALEGVISQLGLNQTPDELGKHVFAQAQTDSTLLTITADDPDPNRAAAIANALAQLLISSSPAIQGVQSDLQASIQAQLKATLDQIEATQADVQRLGALQSPTPANLSTLETLQGRLVTLRSTYASLLSASAQSASNLLTVVEPAIAANSPVSPRTLLNTLLAAVIGLLLAAAVAAIVEFLDDRVKNADAVQEIARLSTLGSVGRMSIGLGRPEFYRLATLINPRSGVAEAYRTLRTNIEFASVDSPVNTLLVTSSRPHEGKTVTAANLAVAYAQADRRTILVDADLRKPGVHLMFGIPNEDGLTTMLRDEKITVAKIAHSTEQANLRIVTTGPLPPNPAELLGSQRMRRALDKLKADAEIVIFDTPPVQVVVDAVVMSSYLDATVLVVDVGRSRRGALRQAGEALARANANVLGVILNRVPGVSRASDHGYYHEDVVDTKTDKRPRAPKSSPT